MPIAAILALVALSAGSSAAEDFDARLTDLAKTVETASMRGDVNGLRSALGELEKMPTAQRTSEQSSLLEYTAAYARWRLAVLPGVTGKEKDKLLDTAVEELTAALKATPSSAEALGLLGSVYGMQIGRSMFRGMTLGPKAGKKIGEARKLEPDNPRLALQEGMSAFHAPGLFGGGVDKAERLLRQALALFEKEPRDRPWPNWGRFDAHAWLGQALFKKGDRAGAKAEYEKALAIAPESAWVRSVLLPALEAKR